MRTCWPSCLTSQGEEASDNSQENEHLGSTQGEEGEDEADDQDDEAAEERGGSRSSPRCKTETHTLVRQTDVPGPKLPVKASDPHPPGESLWGGEGFPFVL